MHSRTTGRRPIYFEGMFVVENTTVSGARSKWIVDPGHSTVEFGVKHMMFTTVKGNFEKFEAEFTANPDDLTSADVSFVIDASSVHTRDEGRDQHLRSADFFDVENHPQIKFSSTKVTRTGNNQYDVTGDLTIRDVTKPITFHVVYDGQGKTPFGDTVAAFTADASLDRHEYGLTWNVALEAGGVLVSQQIKIHAEVQAKQA